MRILLFVLALSVALSCVATPTVTNATPCAMSVTAVTNMPAARVLRQQCEAVTKSGNRCKRNAVPGEKHCRQHLKIVNRASGGSGVAH